MTIQYSLTTGQTSSAEEDSVIRSKAPEQPLIGPCKIVYGLFDTYGRPKESPCPPVMKSQTFLFNFSFKYDTILNLISPRFNKLHNFKI